MSGAYERLSAIRSYWMGRDSAAECHVHVIDIDELLREIDMRGNVLGRIAVLVLGNDNNVPDENVVLAVQRAMKVVSAARVLANEGQEYSFDDIGLGRGAPNSYWEDLDDALDDELDNG